MADSKKKRSKASKTTEKDRINLLTARVEELEHALVEAEAKITVITDGYEFAANEIRPLYGFGAVAAVFDAIHRKLSGK